MCVEGSVAQLIPILHAPVDCSLPGSSVKQFSCRGHLGAYCLDYRNARAFIFSPLLYDNGRPGHAMVSTVKCNALIPVTGEEDTLPT